MIDCISGAKTRKYNSRDVGDELHLIGAADAGEICTLLRTPVTSF